jgi:SAM-dependent methyltransferase
MTATDIHHTPGGSKSDARSHLRRAYGHPLLYMGRRLECPVCGGRFRRMRHGRGRRDVQCPRCGSYERVRALWLFLREESDLADGGGRVLHFAPEPGIASALAALPGVDYLSADLAPGVAMEVADITAIPHPEGAFDAVVCSHVLEHVPDDRRAMAEVLRVLAPGGAAYFMQPVDFERAETYEDASIVEPAARERAFNQHNHVRIYGRDIAARLREARFELTERRYTEELDPTMRARYALQDGDATAREDVVFVAVKPDGRGKSSER